MELMFRTLQFQVTASRNQVQIEGSVPALGTEAEDLVTIVQTSACRRNQNSICVRATSLLMPFEQALRLGMGVRGIDSRVKNVDVIHFGHRGL